MFRDKGVIHQRSCVYSLQQNGIVKRKHRHLLNTARAILFHLGLSTKFWGESILMAMFIINCLPSKILNWKSPYEILNYRPPDYEKLKVFGCLAYAANVNPHKGKFDVRAQKCLFLGYQIGQKGYKLYDLETYKLFTARDVIFHEDVFPMKEDEVTTPTIPLPVLI